MSLLRGGAVYAGVCASLVAYAITLPHLWTIWLFMAAIAGALLHAGQTAPSSNRKFTGLLFSWGLANGCCLLMAMMAPKPSMVVGLMVLVFFLWLLAHLSQRTKTDQANTFLTYGLLNACVSGVLIITTRAPNAAVVAGLLVLAGMVSTLALSYSHASTGATMASGRWKTVGACLVLTLLGALPFAATRVQFSDAEFQSIGALPSITSSNRAVMRAVFQGEAPTDPYWEHGDQYVLPTRDGQWISLTSYMERLPEMQAEALLEQHSVQAFREGVGQETYVYEQGLNQDARFPLNGFKSVDIVHRNGADLAVHTVHRRYRDKPLKGFTPQLDALYLSIPENPDATLDRVDQDGARKHMPRTWALVQSWKAEGLTDQQLADRALGYFKQNLAYHFDHQFTEPEKNQLDWFLFEDRKGVCRHFANAFALMMRMGGVRSRVRGGFHGGRFDEENNSWTVHARDAHAWTEVWLDGRGWVLIDPTGVVPTEKGIPQSIRPNWMGDGSEAFEHVSWMTGFDTAGSNTVGSSKTETLLAPLRQAMRKASGMAPPSLLPIASVILVLGILAMAWRQRTREAPIPRQWRKLMAAMEKRGAIVGRHTGPRTLGKRLAWCWPVPARKEWMETVEAYERWRFGGHETPGLARSLRRWRARVRRDFNQP